MSNLQNKKYIAKTFYGLEEVLAKELEELGADNVEPITRAVSFEGTKELMYKANLKLHTALKSSKYHVFKNRQFAIGLKLLKQLLRKIAY